jgi:hypothetical protein
MINAKTEKIQGKYGPFDALVLSGDTKPVMNQLKSMGFRWYGPKQVWWMASKNVGQPQIDALKNLGVTFGVAEKPLEQPQKPIPPQETSKKQWVTEEPEMSKWYGFPINKNIMSYPENVNVDGKDYPVEVTIDRSYVLGGDRYTPRKSRDYRGKPKYLINILIPEIDYKHSWKYISKQLWGAYDEDTLLNTTIKEIVKKNILESPNTVPGVIRYKNELAKRTPEYKQFLNDIGANKIKPSFDFHIDDPLYAGDYKVEVDDLGADEKTLKVYIHTLVDREGAPSSATVAYEAPLDGTYTIEDFNRKIKEFLISYHDDIQEKYIKYLKLFPFLTSQKEEAGQSVEKIKSILASPESSVNKVFDELKARGYIRPHKRQKQYTGLTKGEEITWIVDSKKIVNDAYGFNSYLSHTPDYFYAVVAYYIHRQVRNISSWTDMMLVDAMNVWQNSMKRFGIDLDWKEVERIITIIGNAILNIFRKNVEPESGQETSGEVTDALKEFANLALKYGISIEGLENNVRNIYRTLAKYLHPDKYPDPKEKEEKTREFQDLQNLYDSIPAQYKAAHSWYDLYVESEIAKDIITTSIKKC